MSKLKLNIKGNTAVFIENNEVVVVDGKSNIIWEGDMGKLIQMLFHNTLYKPDEEDIDDFLDREFHSDGKTWKQCLNEDND